MQYGRVCRAILLLLVVALVCIAPATAAQKSFERPKAQLAWWQAT
jgi:hypothetical protein